MGIRGRQRPLTPPLRGQIMRAHGVKNLVFSSSATVYGNPQYLPLDEAHPTGGCTNPYGKSKFFIEEMIRDLCQADKVRAPLDAALVPLMDSRPPMNLRVGSRAPPTQEEARTLEAAVTCPTSQHWVGGLSRDREIRRGWGAGVQVESSGLRPGTARTLTPLT